MSDELRTIDVTLEDGIEQSAGKVAMKFFDSVDESFRNNVVRVKSIHGENPEAAPATLQFETDADPEAMVIEVQWMAETHFQNVSACVVPTDEAIEEAMEDIEPHIGDVDTAEGQARRAEEAHFQNRDDI